MIVRMNKGDLTVTVDTAKSAYDHYIENGWIVSGEVKPTQNTQQNYDKRKAYR